MGKWEPWSSCCHRAFFEVEFSDDDGRTYAQLPIRDNQLMVLHLQPQQAGFSLRDS